MPNDDLESRLASLEHEVARLSEHVALVSSDAAAGRVLAAGADRDVSEVRAELRAHTQVLNALRETQVELLGAQLEFRETQLKQGQELLGLRRDVGEQSQELTGLREDVGAQGQELAGLRRDVGAQGQELTGLRQEMHEGFATLVTGMAEITTLVSKITGVE